MSIHHIRTNIYIKPDDKLVLLRKASKNGFSLSRFLVLAGLNYTPSLKNTQSTISETEVAKQ